MKNAIRCFISCILPCGALDVVRIVHCNGRVEEISGTVRAEEVMRAHPMHVLKKQSSPSSSDEAVVPKIVIVPPDAQLKRGSIYFLMPAAGKPEKKPPSLNGRRALSRRKRSRAADRGGRDSLTNPLIISDRYLTDILSEKQSSSQRDLRRGRVGIWRPHLESIYEASSDL